MDPLEGNQDSPIKNGINENEPIKQSEIPENKSPDKLEKADQEEEEGKQNENEQDLMSFIEILREHQDLMEKQGNFVEAEIAQNRINELKNQLNTKMQEQLKSRHLNEKLELEENHVQEFNQFNKDWEEKETKFKSQAEQQQETIKQKQDEILTTETEKFEKTLPQIPKPSVELLNLRKIQANLAKQKNFSDAHQVQTKIKQIEEEEAQRWQKEKAHKVTIMQTKLYKKFENEQNAFEKKISSAFEQLRKQKALELEKMLQKYQNAKKEMESKHLSELKEIRKKPYSPKRPQSKSSPTRHSKIQNTSGENQQKI